MQKSVWESLEDKFIKNKFEPNRLKKYGLTDFEIGVLNVTNLNITTRISFNGHRRVCIFIPKMRFTQFLGHATNLLFSE